MATPNGTLTTTHANGTSGGATPPRITLYTNHTCPFAQRAHIVLEELKIPFEEVLIDLDTPRPQWYLDINPRGLVPSMKYTVPGLIEEQIIYGSAIVAQFLADSFPSPLLPASREDPTAPLRRARIAFFTETWNSKLAPLQFGLLTAPVEEKQTRVDEFRAVVKKEIEPLLEGAGPFFGGSKDLTLAEAIVGPFLLRIYAFANGKYIPTSLREGLSGMKNFGPWAEAVMSHPSVTKMWNGDEYIQAVERRRGGMFVAIE